MAVRAEAQVPTLGGGNVQQRSRQVLVTGGCGFIGSHLVRALLSQGREVVVFDNLSTGFERNLAPGARLVRGDVRDEGQIARAVQTADVVFHLAANSNTTVSINAPRADFETNTQGTFNVLEAAFNAQVEKVVYVSSASVYGVPQSTPIGEHHPIGPFVPYGASKFSGEIFCNIFYETYDLPVVIVRPFCVYGPGENPEVALVEVSRYLRWHLNGGPIHVVGDPDRKTRDFVHVSDVVRGLIMLADHGAAGEIYNLGSGEEVTIRQLTDAIGVITDRRTTVLPVLQMTEDSYRLVSDISKARSHGYAPRVSLDAGLRQLVQHLGPHPTLPSGETIFREGQQDLATVSRAS